MALSTSDLVSVSINVSPTAAATASFSGFLIIGDSTVITTTERVRLYTSLAAIATDFTTTAKEYLAAAIYFAQVPAPQNVYIGVKGTGETFLQALSACSIASSAWYGSMFACATMPAAADYIACASYIEAVTPVRTFGVVDQEIAAATTGDTTSIGYQLSQLKLSRTVWQYSSTSPYAIAAFFGRALSVNFNMNKSTITMMWKQEVLVVAETLTESQAAQLKLTHGNVFVNYNNGTAIVQNGTCAGGRFFDEVIGLDWLQNSIQTNVWNLLYQSQTKIPQTNAGVGMILTSINQSLDQAVKNGLVAPGKWNVGGFGGLNLGDYLPLGYYVYATPMESQSQADRETRIAPPIQIAVKLAGAIHAVAISVNVNR